MTQVMTLGGLPQTPTTIAGDSSTLYTIATFDLDLLSNGLPDGYGRNFQITINTNSPGNINSSDTVVIFGAFHKAAGPTYTLATGVVYSPITSNGSINSTAISISGVDLLVKAKLTVTCEVCGIIVTMGR